MDKEFLKVITITIIILALGVVGALYLTPNNINTGNNEFNFFRAEITIKENLVVEETLYYYPDKAYHTLFRDFTTPVIHGESNVLHKNAVVIEGVECDDGIPYASDRQGICKYYDSEVRNECLPFTESNEYGCTYGNEYGFLRGKEYWTRANYVLLPENVYLIEGKHYVKYVAYSEGNHKDLEVGKNLIINTEMAGIEHKEGYGSRENVIIYIPYEENPDEKMLTVINGEFGYDGDERNTILLIILSLFPGIIFYLTWHYQGRERSSMEVPKELSTYPKERKGWEVAAYFNPPFSTADKNFYSALITELYYKKVIDIKLVNKTFSKEIMIKILPHKNKELDGVEKEYLNNLHYVIENADEKYFSEGYINLNKASQELARSWKHGTTMRKNAGSMTNKVREIGKEYLDTAWSVILIVLGFMIIFALTFNFLILLAMVIAVITYYSSALMVRFKKEYYKEYQQWQAFKNYLNRAPSLKIHGHKGVVLWEQYLIYATAFGIAKKVLEELKREGIINERQYTHYTAIHVAIASNTGGASAGGMGGAGAGGVGGGGGGGR